uniref:Soluble scavenger receptor cysteine-rich domain-containing protein SSC5D n=1 Tax=Callorhinchus milii TaxID=7868 RepID=A0A4W3GLV0_CALMI
LAPRSCASQTDGRPQHVLRESRGAPQLHLGNCPVPIRLVDGQTMCSGRVEVLHSSIWGSVCGDHWGMEEASVVCRLLNCGDATSATGNATFGQGTGRVWLSDVRCNGTEAALDQCPAKPYGNNNCHHSQDAGIICSGKEISPALFSLIQIIIEPKPKSFLPPSLSGPVPVRLVDGNNMCSGRVEVLHNSTWGSVCGDRWDKKGASVVCRALNCGGARSATVNATFGNDTGPIWLSNLRCEGTEAAVDQCSSNPWNTNNAVELASSFGRVYTVNPEQQILVNGNNMCSGRVEVLHNSTWESVHGDHWGTEEANVVCRLLNCGEATSATGNAAFGQGTGPVWLSDVRCNGTEVALDQCFGAVFRQDLGSHDTPFRCPVPVRLVNGNNMCSGRVEVLHDTIWGTVCGDHWGTQEANVVCRLLNCGEATSATGNASFGQGTGPVWLSDVRCNGTEAALDQCPAKPYGINTCHHSQDASVTCVMGWRLLSIIARQTHMEIITVATVRTPVLSAQVSILNSQLLSNPNGSSVGHGHEHGYDERMGFECRNNNRLHFGRMSQGTERSGFWIRAGSWVQQVGGQGGERMGGWVKAQSKRKMFRWDLKELRWRDCGIEFQSVGTEMPDRPTTNSGEGSNDYFVLSLL